jgi:acyl-CoA synthetase (AMP-forming)/AMP-acid ligase II/acyl carrier protein
MTATNRLTSDLAAPICVAASMLEILRWRADHEPHRLAYTFLEDGETTADSLTCGSLERQARAIASRLLGDGAAGERALLLHPPGLEFLVALFGCFYAGVTAVPLYPPKLNRRDRRWIDIARDSSARFALTTAPVLRGLQRGTIPSPELGAFTWIVPEDVHTDARPAPSAIGDGVLPDSLAYLQYTSGSTRAPKGVMVSHRNLMANIEDFQRAFQHSTDSVGLSWLPHFHDMGLVYGLLLPFALRFPCYFMPPAAFLQKPLRWLQAISRLGATHSGGPNFAYELCVDRVSPEQSQDLDLSTWIVAINGAEPVRRETLRKFGDAFARCGFSRTALCPGYGLAEATLRVTTSRVGREAADVVVSSEALGRGQVKEAAATDADAKALVSCGAPQAGTEVAIINYATLSPCSEDQVGEIWVNSASVATGYWNRPDESATVFQASVAGDEQQRRYLRTGDLGFLRGGELFVTGRIKDLIIVRGRNHYPHDIELTVQNCHAALRTDAGAAFSVEIDAEERLVVVQEIDRHRHDAAKEAIAAIRTAIVDEHDIAPHAVVLVRQNEVPKTSSGKIQRRVCARAFLDGTLQIVAEWKVSTIERTDAPPVSTRGAEEIVAFLQQKLASGLAVRSDEVDITEPFSSFGLDSLRTMELLSEMETWLGRPLSPTVFWNYPSIADLTAHLAGADSQSSGEDGRG